MLKGYEVVTSYATEGGARKKVATLKKQGITSKYMSGYAAGMIRYYVYKKK